METDLVNGRINLVSDIKVIDEEQKLKEIDDLFEFIMKVQSKISPDVCSEAERTIGQGRKGVMLIRGSRKWVRVFEVDNGVLTASNDIENARTVIAFENVDIFRGLVQELLNGSTSALSKYRARGEIRIVGDHAIRDLSAINRLLTKVGQILNDYGVRLGG